MKKNGTKKSIGAKSIVHELVPRANRQTNSIGYSPEHVDFGILGGMGPQATEYFVEQLLRAVETRRTPQCDQDYPSLIVRYACYLPDRTAALETDVELFAEAFIREVRTLLELGCPRIVVPCITSHAVIHSRLTDLPIVDIPRVVAGYLRQEWPGARVGVLATRGAHLAGVIDKFVQPGQPVLTLGPEEEEELMALIYRKAKTWQGQSSASEFLEFADRLRRLGCDVVIAGCTEVETFLARSGCDKTNLIFPLRIVAEAFTMQWMNSGPSMLGTAPRSEYLPAASS